MTQEPLTIVADVRSSSSFWLPLRSYFEKHCWQDIHFQIWVTLKLLIFLILLSLFIAPLFKSKIVITFSFLKGAYLFEHVTEKWDDKVIGAVLLVASLALMSISLILIVKLLQSILQGKVAKVIRKFLNSDFPGPLRYLTGYVAILIGCGVTIMVQSSSIFTSSLTPLVGMGVITVDRMYPLTLGSNIGTTFTAVLAALASDNIHDTLQIALCHLFFNICGIIIWYPIPFMRKVPINMAKFLGTTTAKYRWFAILYIIVMFFLFPLSVFALSLPGWYVLLAVYGPIVIIAIIVLIVKAIQSKRPQALPEKFRDWKWLPEWMRSLAPLDRLLTRCNCCEDKRCCGCCDKGVNITDP